MSATQRACLKKLKEERKGGRKGEGEEEGKGPWRTLADPTDAGHP